MIKFNNKIFIIIAIIILTIIIGTILKERETRETIINSINSDIEIKEWFNANDAVNNVRKIFMQMKRINNNYDFYRKYLSENEIDSYLSHGYTVLFSLGLSKEDVDRILTIFAENNIEGYNSFENYTKLIGEKAYYKQENSNCSARIYTTIYDDFIIVQEKVLDKNSTRTAEYKLILKDKDLKILDVIDGHIFTFGYDYDKSHTIYDKKNVDKVEYYFNLCY